MAGEGADVMALVDGAFSSVLEQYPEMEMTLLRLQFYNMPSIVSSSHQIQSTHQETEPASEHSNLSLWRHNFTIQPNVNQCIILCNLGIDKYLAYS